jgi:hypothetical protein
MTTHTAITLYLANVEQTIVPPAPILIDEHFFVRSPAELEGARLIAFSPADGFPIALWQHQVLEVPDQVPGLHANFISRAKVWRHPLPVSAITIRQTPGNVQVVITDMRTGKRYRPYLGNDSQVATRVASAWGRSPDFTADITTVAS